MSDVTNAQPEGSSDPSPEGAIVTPVPEVPGAEAASAPSEPPITEPSVANEPSVGNEPASTETDEPIEVEPHEVPRHFSAPALLPLARLADDETFRIRGANELDDVAALATDIARLGQLFPIDVRLVPPDRIQIITGFRRVAALRFLHREKVVARLHTELSDADALLMALASAIHSKSVDAETLLALQERLEAEGALNPAARDMLAKALSDDDSLAPENVEEEVDADELAADVTLRLSQCNQDLSLLADVFDQLDDEKRDALLTQLRYSIDLVGFLESKK